MSNVDTEYYTFGILTLSTPNPRLGFWVSRLRGIVAIRRNFGFSSNGLAIFPVGSKLLAAMRGHSLLVRESSAN